MSGTNETVTAGINTSDASTSRPRTAEAPQTEAREDFRDLHLAISDVQRLSSGRESYQSWIGVLAERLSEEGKAIVASPFFQHLRDVPHSTAAHSRLFNHIDLTRYDHCIHAAASVRALNTNARLGLTPREEKVLELALLLHDPHRLGSHALDRVFASMLGAPQDFNEWWPANDFHEYHGAVAIANDSHLRSLLGGYYGEVMTILTWDDRRPDEEKFRDYGDLQCTINAARLGSLKRLEDELDRCSYLKLDYLRSGFRPKLIAAAIADVERHERTLTARGSGFHITIDDPSGERPYEDVALHRSFYRAELATLPVGCLVEQVLFHKGVWDRARADHTKAYLSSPTFYKDIRDKALAGRYAEIFSPEALQLLESARTGVGLSVEDVYAPLVTLTLDDLRDRGGLAQFKSYVFPAVAEQYCGVPRRDMTVLESWIRRYLQRAGFNADIYLLISNDFGKTFEYDVSRAGGDLAREKSEIPCSRSLIKVIIATRALDVDGSPLQLSDMKERVSDYLIRSGLLVNPSVLDKYNPRIFCDLVTDGYYSEAIRLKVTQCVPEWIRQGGCGLT